MPSGLEILQVKRNSQGIQVAGMVEFDNHFKYVAIRPFQTDHRYSQKPNDFPAT